MRSSYRLRLRSISPYPIPYLNEPLTSDVVLRSLAGATVRELTGSPYRGYDLHLCLQRGSDADALEEIAVMAGRFGLSVAEAYVVRWVTVAAETAVGGAIAGSSTHAITKNPAVTFLVILAGGVAGYLAGSLIERVGSVLRAECHPLTRTWSFEPFEGGPEPVTRPAEYPGVYLGPVMYPHRAGSRLGKSSP